MAGGTFEKNREDVFPVPQQVLAQGFGPTMRHLASQITRYTIAPRVDALREAKAKYESGEREAALGVLEHRLSPNEADINAEAAYFTEATWREISNWRERHPTDLGQLVVDKIHGDELGTKSFADIEATPLTYNQRTDAVYNRSLDIVAYHVGKYFAKCRQERSELTPDKWSFDTRVHDSYHEALGTSPFHKQEFLSGPADHLKSGFATAAKFTWGILKELPHLYQKETGIGPTEDELEKLIEAGRKFVLDVASLELGILGHVQDGIVVTTGQGGQTVSLPQLKNLRLKKENGAYSVDVEEKTLKAIAGSVADSLAKGEFLKGKPVRTVCPAMFAFGQSGKNVIVEFYDWYADLARKFYFPNSVKKPEASS